MKQREIKFRVWDNVDYMSEPFTLQDLVMGKIKFTPECKVMQFTGLKDKNGVDVYEGDVLKVSGETQKYYDDDLFEPPETVEFELMVEVIYNDKIASFDMHTIETDLNMKNWGFYGEDSQAHIEIIGNIHEHKHLLK